MSPLRGQVTRVLLYFLLLFFIIPADASRLEIGGRVLSDSGAPLAGTRVTVNGAAATTNEAGRFTVAAASNDLYSIRFSADGHFPMIHTFSAHEFAWQGDSEQVAMPDVTLVEKTEGRVMLAFGGDAMMGRRFSQPYDGDPVLIREGQRAGDTQALLQYIRPYLELADFTSLNLETQIMGSKPEKNAPKSYVFYTPPEALHALKESGVDYVTLGNNHIFDYLDEGLESTIAAVEASGLGWSGAGRNEAESLNAHRVELRGNRLSFLGFLGWAGNFTPNQVAEGNRKGGAAFGTTGSVRNGVRREAEAGYLPVIQYHGSREYTDEPTLATETRLKQAIDEGAVLAIAHHPHVVQGFEIYDGSLIAWSMGNFIFDQYHYATSFSYMLYVWMDGDRLHRAEVMPLHIKGYVPMPATDTVRQAVLKRAAGLSARRGVVMQSSGGHAVIVPGGSRDRQSGVLTVPESVPGADAIWQLEPRGWNEPVGAIAMGGRDTAKIRLGQNLLPTGHLESHYLNGAPDRSWIEDGAQTVIAADEAPSGNMVMQLVVPAGQAGGRIGMRTFEYTFEPGTPTTFTVKARVDSPAVITAYQQWRKRNDNRLEALASAKLRLIGQTELDAGDWQQLRFNFDSPRVTAISYRVVLTVEPADTASDHHSWFDDIALIEWLGPPLAEGRVPAHVPTAQASHAGIVLKSD